MARRGLGKGLRAYFPDLKEENARPEVSHQIADQGEETKIPEHAVDRKAKLEELDMVLPGGTRKGKAAADTKKSRKRPAPKSENRREKPSEKAVMTKNSTDSIKGGSADMAVAKNELSDSGNPGTGNLIEKVRTESVPEQPGNIREQLVNIAQIEPNQGQPRKYFNEDQLNELAESVKNFGILQPLLVQKKGEFYEIIAGERRWRAAKLAGLKEVPVLIRDYTKQQTLEIALIENVQRADLNPIEEAKAYQMLVQEFGLKQEEVAERVSKNRATVTNSMRLLKLDERVQQMLVENLLSGGHARALLGLEDREQQYELAKKVTENQLSVRQVEKLVKMMAAPKKEKKADEEERDLSFIYRDIEEKLKSVMGTKVTINKKDKNKGRIEIEYYSPAELERIIDLLESIQG